MTEIDALPSIGYCSFGKAANICPGGTGLNFAVAVRRMGIKSGFAGFIGKDIFGREIKNILIKEDIDDTYLREIDMPNGLIINMSSNDGKCMYLSLRKNCADVQLRFEDLEMAYINKAGALYVSGIDITEGTETWISTLVKVVKEAKIAGTKTFFDPNLRMMGNEIPEKVREKIILIIKYCDVFLPNENELAVISKEKELKDSFNFIMKIKPETDIWVKKGRNGSIFYSSKRTSSFSAFKTKSVDTMGAGDAFNAGVVYSYLRGENLENTGRIANAIASITVSRKGATNVFPGIKEVQKFLSAR